MAKLSRTAESPSRNSSGEDLNRLEPAANSFHVNGGDGNYSYFRNSYQQRVAAEGVKEKIEDEILTRFDVEKLCSTSNTICLADLGCAVGPNTFTAMQDIIKVMNNKYHLQRPESKMPEFQVFFNDQASNDFNTFFKCLPKEREYLAAVVAGSFYGRLFPESSIHFAHSSYALHWLSRVPEELLDKQSAAWNKGRVHYTNARDEVVNAYASQFGKDMEKFLDARAKEIVVGGMMTIIMPGIPDGMRYSQLSNSVMYETMASIFMDMASEGMISEDQVDAFNLPIYAAPPAEMAALVEKNGHFSIERLELTNTAPRLDGPIDIPPWVMHVRAAMEEMFTTHFEDEIIEEMFNRLTTKLLELSDEVESRFWKRTQLFLVLMRK